LNVFLLLFQSEEIRTKMEGEKSNSLTVANRAGPLVLAHRSVAELKLSPKNPRVHTPRQIRQIARSIATFGFIVPVLIDAQGNVIAGHGRVLAARLLG
jgi:hypothetical protein